MSGWRKKKHRVMLYIMCMDFENIAELTAFCARLVTFSKSLKTQTRRPEVSTCITNAAQIQVSNRWPNAGLYNSLWSMSEESLQQSCWFAVSWWIQLRSILFWRARTHFSTLVRCECAFIERCATDNTLERMPNFHQGAVGGDTQNSSLNVCYIS